VKPGVLVAGGAGFVGSHIVKRFHHAGYAVTVVDGLLPRTGGRRANLQAVLPGITFIEGDIRQFNDLPAILKHCEITVDCMAWTSHRQALQDPLYDLGLNAESHLHLLRHLRDAGDHKVIYLGSRGQYGNPLVAEITEESPMVPEDIQGIHKCAAEWYYRVYAKLRRLNIISLRFPNCFGENQPTDGEDIGLIGGLIRDVLGGRVVEIFGSGRMRSIVYAGDVAEVVYQISQKALTGFTAFNMGGQQMTIEALAQLIISAAGQGRYALAEAPEDIKKIDLNNARMNDDRLRGFLGDLPASDLRSTLAATIGYFKDNMT